ncbi:MAG: sugar phosphate isomerase/epimerase [Caldilineaceae bacterium]|nr:sugar phosphate isomerase/epimerase [Caldilineaceae bacterium]
MPTSLPIAVQLYTLRNVQMPFDQLLGEVAAIGYAGVETTSNHGCTADEMNALLEKHGLRIASAHVGLPVFESDFAGVVTFNKAVGNDTLVVPWVPEALRAPDAAGWQALGRTLADLAKRVNDAGLRLLYHNHAFEMAEIDGRLAIDWLLDTAPSVGFEIDLAWVQRGGQDGVAMLKQYAGRCPRIHCKDLAPEGENQDEMGFADVGHGLLDWAALLPAAKAGGAEWYVVEHDLPKEPLTSIRRSYEFLSKKLG